MAGVESAVVVSRPQAEAENRRGLSNAGFPGQTWKVTTGGLRMMMTMMIILNRLQPVLSTVVIIMYLSDLGFCFWMCVQGERQTWS
jgi:hypothetical protein